VPADLSRPEAPGAIAAEVAGLGLEVAILINNAGFGGYGRFWERPAADDLAMVQVNVASLTALSRLFLPAMVARGRGRILNVSSTAGFLPGPLQAVYYATKAYVTSLSEALAEELRDTGVTVTALCPGPVATEFAEVAGAQGSRLFKIPVSNPGTIADHGYRAMLAGKRVAIKEPLFKPLRVVAALTPRSLLLRMSRRLMERS